jgi:predicted RNase H-like HicB family nuclease
MASHDEILEAVRRIAAARADWSFTPDEIVRALPHLNAGTVRTHITSRCCTNAPKNHPHKWDYFKRLRRGLYQLTTRYRPSPRIAGRVREQRGKYTMSQAQAPRRTIHAAINRGQGWYSAECLEIAVVTQGRTLDQTLANLKEAIALHLEGDETGTLGLSTPLALHVTFDDSVA